MLKWSKFCRTKRDSWRRNIARPQGLTQSRKFAENLNYFRVAIPSSAPLIQDARSWVENVFVHLHLLSPYSVHSMSTLSTEKRAAFTRRRVPLVTHQLLCFCAIVRGRASIIAHSCAVTGHLGRSTPPTPRTPSALCLPHSGPSSPYVSKSGQEINVEDLGHWWY